MGAYVAVKMPLLIALTLGCNGLLNGLLGLLLGTGLGFRQSFLALLMSFALAALLLGSLAPITLFLAWNAPAANSPQAETAHSAYLLLHTFLIGFAGVSANLHLHRLLAARAPNRTAANLTLFAWLVGNGFLGAQFSWVLRPFFGTPSLEVEFLRPHPMEGTFYDALWYSLQKLTGGPIESATILITLLCLLAIVVALSLATKKQSQS